MADYTTVSALKNYLRTTPDEDAALGALITRASAMIDTYCGRWFSPIVETRCYAAHGNHITGRLLLLDADLLSVSAISLGDGPVVNPASYILRPVNWPPYFGVSLKQNSGLHWSRREERGDGGSPERGIAVSGTWGYALTTPEPVVTAAIRLAAWVYRQARNGQEPEAPDQAARLPGDIRQLLGPYVRLRISAYSGAA